MYGVKLPVLINCVILVILLVINGAGTSNPWLAWVQTSRRWTRLRAIMDPVTWIASSEKPYHLLLSSESAVDKAYFAIGYDQATQYIYWSDAADKRIYRQRQNDSLIIRNPDTVELVYDGTSNEVLGIAVDWFSGAVYWTDAVYHSIYMTRAIPGRQDLTKVVIDSDLDQPSGIVVHPVRGEMYFADRGQSVDGWKIEKASLLGENREVLLSQRLGSEIGRPESLTYDYDTDNLYWVDVQNYVVKAYNMQGGGSLHTVVTGLTPGISWPGITNFQDYIFLSAQADLQIHAYNKNGGQLVKKYTVDATPHHLVIAGQVSNPPTECENLGCEHFCVSTGNGRGQCVCADGYYIELDGKSCLSVDPQYIFSRGRSIWHADVTIPQNAPHTVEMLQTPFITDVAQVQALAFHFKKKFLFLNDIQRDILYRNTPLESAKEEITVNTRQVEGMSVNWITDALYWADYSLGHIMCSQLDGRYHSILVDNAGQPRGMTVDAIHKKLYWINENGQHKSIMSANLDGSNVGTLYTQHLNAPQGLTVDSRTSRLYWTDRVDNSIFSIDISGNDRKSIVNLPQDPYQTVYGVTIFKDYATWTIGNQDLRFGQQSPLNPNALYDVLSDIRSTPRPNYGQPDISNSYDVITYDSYMQPNTASDDSCKTSRCQQHCFPNPSGGHTCACAIGFTLNEDGMSCDSDVTTSDFLLYTDPYHKQIYQQPLGDDTPQGLPLPLMDFPVSMDIDSDATVFWIDRKAAVIQSSKVPMGESDEAQAAKLLRQIPQGFRPTTLVLNNQKGHVLYTDSQAGAIYRMNKDGTNHDAIITGVGRASGLALDTERGYIFWTETGSSARLMRANYDGTEQTVLLHDANQIGRMAVSLTYRQEDGLLYWADQDTGRIGLYNTTSGGIRVWFENSEYQIISLTAGQGYLYFTTYNKKGIYRLDRFDAFAPLTILGGDIYARIYDIRVFNGEIIPPVPVIAVGEGTPWTIIGAAIGAAVLLLFLIVMIGLCAARRKKKPASTPIVGSDTSDPAIYDNVDQDYVNVTNATAVAAPVVNGGSVREPNGSVPNGIPPPPDAPPPEPPVETAQVHFTNNGYTPDENGAPSSVGPAVAVLPAGPVPKPSKKKAGTKRFRKKDQPPKIDPNDFQLGEDQKVATVIQRLAHRLRNRLSSVRFSGGPVDQGGQDQHVPEYDPEAADGVPGGPERGKGPGPKKNITYPPQLHRPPRGFAPASHAVPVGALKSTWGRGKHQKMMGKKK